MEKDVRSDYQALFELVEDLGSRQTPTLRVGDRVILGFDPVAYDEGLREET